MFGRVCLVYSRNTKDFVFDNTEDEVILFGYKKVMQCKIYFDFELEHIAYPLKCFTKTVDHVLTTNLLYKILGVSLSLK